MSRKIVFVLGAALTLLLAVVPTQAKQLVVALGSQHLDVHSPGEQALGDYYTLSLPIPAAVEGAELFGAYLEFYVDVDAREVGEVTSNSPTLDVYALTGEVAQGFDEEDLGTPAMAPGNVMVGSNRRVLRDVTTIVRSYLDESASNHGLILGSLTGERDGLFTLKTGVLSEGVVARLILHYRRR
jgi:hypothetical protein